MKGSNDPLNTGLAVFQRSNGGAICVDVAGNTFDPINAAGHTGEEIFITQQQNISATGVVNIVQLSVGATELGFGVDDPGPETELRDAQVSGNVLLLGTFGTAANCTGPAQLPNSP